MAKTWNQSADKFARAAKKSIKVRKSRDDWEDDEDEDFRTQRNTERVESDTPEVAPHR